MAREFEQGQIPEFAQRPEAEISRSANPLLEPIPPIPNALDHLTFLVNHVVQEYGGKTLIEKPEIRGFRERNGDRLVAVVPIPFTKLSPENVLSLRHHLENLWQASAISHMTESSGFIAVKSWRSHPDGFYIQEGKLWPPFKKKPGRKNLELHNDLQELSETEVAYQAAVAALILGGQIDISTPQKLEETKAQRQEIFMKIYHRMLKEMIPQAQRGEIYGLDQQIEDVEENLYGPLKTKKGKPMNTLLVGAPSVGKSLTGRFFAFDQGVISIPTSVKTINDYSFEYQVRILGRIQRALDLPIVLVLDDVEVLLESGLVVDSSGKSTQYIDPEKRSRALNLLERLQDSHNIFLLCTLNHPDVESAFLRRFNPVYFPLPNPEQRQAALQEFIPQGPLPRLEHLNLIQDLAETTTGFNYSGLALIPDYLGNITSRNGNYNSDDFKEALQRALSKAHQRTNLQSLVQYDKAAKEMIESSF